MLEDHLLMRGIEVMLEGYQDRCMMLSLWAGADRGAEGELGGG